MTWTANASGGWTNAQSGSDPSLWTFDTPMTGSGSLVLQIIGPEKKVGAWIYGDPLGTTRYRVRTDGGTGGNLVIEKVVYGTAGSALATAAHTLSDLDAYTLEVRWVGGVITAYINGATTPLVTHDTGNDLATFTAMGFESDQDAAVVSSARLYVLTQVFAALADVFWAVINGTLYASDSGRTGLRSIGTFFDPSVRVSGAEYHQAALILDGSKLVKFDAAAMTAAPHTMAAGTLPGQSALNTPLGATTAKVVISYNDRVLFLKDQYAIATAIDTDDDTDLTATDLGKAFVWPSQVGEPLLGGFVASKNRLILWARRSTWELTGDPAIGAEITRLSDNIGGTGPNSACMLGAGTVLLHSDQGAIVIPPGGNPIPLSQDVLTDIIQTEGGADSLYVSVVRDTKRHGVWILLSTTDGTAPARHLWYDERTGKLDPQAGGFWPQTFASAAIEPTCACRYQGEVIVGTRDGRLMFFDPASAGTDGGADYTSTLALQMVRPDDLERGILLRNFSLAMGLNSDDTDLELVGGETPERAYSQTAWRLWSGTMKYARDSFSPTASAGAVVLKLSNTGGQFALERVQVEWKLTAPLRDRRLPALAPVAVCAPAPSETPTPGEEPGGGPGAGGTDPGTCTACADWMSANTTETVGGLAAYIMGGPNLFSTIGAEVAAAVANIAAQNICDVNAGNIQVWVENILDPDDLWTDQAMAYSTFAGMTQDDLPVDLRDPNKGWRVFFRCEDQLSEA